MFLAKVLKVARGVARGAAGGVARGAAGGAAGGSTGVAARDVAGRCGRLGLYG